MEKLGVDTTNQDEGEKTAQNRDHCPICGKETDKSSNVPKCPDHGTRPFENTKEAP